MGALSKKLSKIFGRTEILSFLFILTFLFSIIGGSLIPNYWQNDGSNEVSIMLGDSVGSPRSAADDGKVAINIAIISENNSTYYDTAFSLIKEANTFYFNPNNISLYSNHSVRYDVMFLLDFIHFPDEVLDEIIKDISSGMGLFYQTNNPSQLYNYSQLIRFERVLPLLIEPYLDENGSLQEVYHSQWENINTREVPIEDRSYNNKSFIDDKINFISLPQLLNLSKSSLKNDSSSFLLVKSDSDWPILAQGNYGKGSVIMLTTPIRENSNEHLANWPVFTYFIYCISMGLSGIDSENIDSFDKWSGSPIPHENQRLIINSVLLTITIITFVAFFYMKSYSKKKPFKLIPVKRKEESNKKNVKSEVSGGNSGIVVGTSVGKKSKSSHVGKNQDQTSQDSQKLEQSGTEIKENNKKDMVPESGALPALTWDDIGFHKPLTGFSIIFYLMLAILLPLILVVMYILPTFILQDPAQFGVIFIIGNIFNAIFIAGDFGLAQAFDKFVGEKYIKDPRSAVKYIQFFVWFQVISGLIQTVSIALIGEYVIPKSMQVNFMAWNFVVKAFVQWPGIAYLFTHTLKSMQRTDKEQMVSLISLIIFDIGGMAAFSALFLSIGKRDPLIGTVLGGAIGVTVAEVVKTFGLLLIGAIVLNKTEKRFTLLDLFRIDFDWELAKETLIFGFKSMLSNVIMLFGNFFVTLIIMLELPNYPYWGSFMGSATLLLYPIQFMVVLYENMLPTNSEAYGAGCKNLVQFYISNGFKYWGLFSSILFIIFVFFVNRTLTQILPPLFKPMGYFIGFYSFTKLVLNAGDYSRIFLISIGKVGKYILFVFIEQTIRVLFFFLLVNRISHPEYLLIFGELPGALIKVIITWLYTNKNIIRVRINVWQTFIAPISAGLIFLLVGSGLEFAYRQLVESFPQYQLYLLLLFAFFICSVLALTFYPFLVGLFGGWDDRGLRDMDFATRHSGPSKMFARLFYKMSVLGASRSPLHNKFPLYTPDIEKDIAYLLELKVKGESME